MVNIVVGRYSAEGRDSHGYAGWIEPEDRTWILFVGTDGHVEAFLDRDPETGAVL